MSIRYYLEESFENLRQNKFRSILTGFGVAWGIFLLVLLLGAGESLYNGTSKNFSRYAENFISFWSPSSPYTTPLLNKLQASIKDIEHIAPSIWFSSSKLRYQGEDYSASTLQGVGIHYAQIMKLVLDQGRFFNQRDETLTRQVCVIGHDVKTALFKKEDPIGKFISVDGRYHQVIGTLDSNTSFNKAFQERVFVPMQWIQKTYGITGFDQFLVSLKAGVSAQAVEDKTKTYLLEQLHPGKTESAKIYTYNNKKEVEKFNTLFNVIRLFLWLVGICMLLSGIVGVSNMMFVLVKERTQEIGIRKVIGASAQEILLMVMTEAIFISLVAGIVGMLAGVGSIHLLNRLIDYINPSMLGHLVFRPSAAITALILLVTAGAIAGLMPARRATAILPIKALNSE
ncbi:MAG: ABC transporter permease [Bacteroidota bacterium]